jgi:hypothetical protein
MKPCFLRVDKTSVEANLYRITVEINLRLAVLLSQRIGEHARLVSAASDKIKSNLVLDTFLRYASDRPCPIRQEYSQAD